jgi:hypothetical protein
LIAVPRVLAADRPSEGTQLDLGGAVLGTGALAALIYGLSSGEQQGFTAVGTVLALAGFVVLGASFVVVERHVASPLLPFSFLAAPTRRAGDGAMLLMGMIVVSYLYFASLYVQRVLGFDPLITGLSFLPSTGVIVVNSTFLARRFIARTSVKSTLITGLVSIGIGQFWLAHVVADGTYWFNVLPGLLFTSFGMGLAFPAASVGATAGTLPKDQGLASGLYNTSQQVGGAIGLALLATIAAAATASDHGALAPGYRLAYLVGTGIAGLAILLVATQLNAKKCQEEAALDRRLPAARQF